MHRAILLLLAVLCLVVRLFAGTSSRALNAARTDLPPQLDGLLNDDAWRRCVPTSGFVQFDPAEGTAPTESTTVRILYTDGALYVGVECLDTTPGGIVGQLTRRDRLGESDRFTVLIDSYHDHQTAFVFSSNVSGIQSDGVLSQDGTVYDITWDAVWRVATAVTPSGWSAEFEIPYNALRFTPSMTGDYEWGINFRRYISRKKETDEWVMVPRSERLQISRWGHLHGLQNIEPPLHLEISPYVSADGNFQSAGMPDGRSSTLAGRTGVDIKYGLSRNFTLDATIHPDFGQVEVDQAVLNLSVFEPYLPEKRPFFIEGAQMFAFGTSVDNTSMPLFFSRRIGRRPSGSYAVQPSAGETVEENPAVTSILGAAKLTGRSSSGLTLGVLAAATDKEEARFKDMLGARRTVLTEPRGSYTVARVKQELGGTSWIGAMGTLAGREGLLPGLSGGVDWNLRFDEGSMTWDGYVVGAMSSAQQKREGTAGRFLLSRIAAEHWLYAASYDFATPYYNPNDLGFFARPRDQGGYLQLLYRENFARAPLRRYSMSLVPEARWNWDRVRTFSQVEASFAADFVNFWRSLLSFRIILPSYEDEQRGIIGIRRLPSRQVVELQVQSDERKAVWASLDALYEGDARGKRSVVSYLSLTYRPTSWMELSPLLYYQRTRKEVAWLFPDGNIVDPAVCPTPFSVFGNRDLDEMDFGLRGIVTFTKTLSIQWYAQVLLARGKYGDYMRAASPENLVAYAYAASPSFSSHDFNEATLNANLLLRWEYLPGSTFYLAWTQERYGDAGNYERGFDVRFRDTFQLPQQNVLLAKLTYWFSL